MLAPISGGGSVRTGLVCAIAVVCLAACVSGDTVSSEAEAGGWSGTKLELDPGDVSAGHVIAQRDCAACHAIDQFSTSPNSSAPPLREVLAVNDAEFLAYRFIDAMRVGHDEMPLFDFDVRSADALIAYIKSIAE